MFSSPAKKSKKRLVVSPNVKLAGIVVFGITVFLLVLFVLSNVGPLERSEADLIVDDEAVHAHEVTLDKQWMQYSFCPVCGAEAMERGVIDHQVIPICSECQFEFWEARTPRPTVSMIIVDQTGEQILIGERGIEPEKGKWNLPGGFIQPHEHPFDAAVREAREELLIELDTSSLQTIGYANDVYGEGGPPLLNIGIAAKIQDNMAPLPGDDNADLKWIDIQEVLVQRRKILPFVSELLLLQDYVRHQQDTPQQSPQPVTSPLQ